MSFTPISEIPSIVSEVRKNFQEGITLDVEWRKQQIRQVDKFVKECSDEIKSAVKSDLNMNDFLCFFETTANSMEAEVALQNLDEWIKPDVREMPLFTFPAKGVVYKEPYGVVLLIAPWNYPIGLILRPLIAILAAGNAVIIKPSEVSPAAASLISSKIPQYFDNRVIKVVTGGPSETTELLKQQFDHIMYTGNGTVAKIIMRAAAEHLTPVTLELGGKCPCVVDKNVDLKTITPKICFGKFMNAGQTCVAVDYLLLHKDQVPAFVDEFKTCIKNFYGDDPSKCKDYGKMITPRHAQRVADLLKDVKCEVGGQSDPQGCYIAPTLVVNPPAASKLMEEEIFGPVLPVLTYDKFEEAIDYVSQRDKPLAAYLYSENERNVDLFTKKVSTGGGCVNDVVMHVTAFSLPFGGVGPSGMGRYAGKDGFENFSNRKAFYMKSKPRADLPLIFPPYSENKIKWFNRIVQLKLPKVKLTWIVLGVAIVIGLLFRNQFGF